MKIIFVVYNVRRHGDKTFLQAALRRQDCDVSEINVGPDGPHKLRGRRLPDADVVIVHGYMTARTLCRGAVEVGKGLKVFYTFNDPPALDANVKAWKALRDRDFRLVIASQRIGLDRYKEISRQAYYVPFGAEPRVFYPFLDVRVTHDVAFIGDLSKERYGKRRAFLDRLRRSGVSVYAHTGPSGEELAKCLCRGRIGWNQTISWMRWGKKQDGINFRTWEVLATGRMLLTNQSSDLERLGFKDGRDLVFYDSFKSCLKKVRYYAEAAGERECIAAAGRRRTLEEHTVDVRAWRMLDIFKSWLGVKWRNV